MPKSLARVCQIGTTNYVDYKGERLTVEEYNLKYKRNIRIPKEVKVCKPIYCFDCFDSEFDECENCKPKHGSKAVKDIPIKNGRKQWRELEEDESRAKKEEEHDIFTCDEDCVECFGYDIDIPNLRRVEEELPAGKIEAMEDPFYYFNCMYEFAKVVLIVLFLASLIIHSLK